MTTRRQLLASTTGWVAGVAFDGVGANSSAPAVKTLRYALPAAESGFDPVQITDLYSRTIVASIFDAPLEFEFLAWPARLRPNTAAELPEIAPDFTRFTLRIKPGIYFADDPAFGGVKRELTAADYVYSIKRHYDPRWKSGNLFIFETAKLLGLSELRREGIAAKKPFDYDHSVDGVKALDRYTLQFNLAEAAPRFAYYLADAGVVGAMAREVVEYYGDRISEHPVGTGPYRLAEWKRSSRIVLERNPGFRERRYDEQAPPGDSRLQQVAREFKGRRLPLIDRVELSIVEEPQPRWLSFLSVEADLVENVPAEYANIVFPNNKLAPNLAKRGIAMVRYPRPDVAVSYFGMESPVVGGYTPEKVALRRAISLAVDVEREIRLVRKGQAIPAQSLVGPGTWGYDPAWKSEMSEFNRARAVALLDMHGYVDRDGDGWRERPDGQPLELEYATSPDQAFRQLAELWKRNMDAIGIRLKFNIAQWPEHLKASRNGKLMMWGVGWSATAPDAQDFLVLGYGPNKGQANHARFDLPGYNELFERQKVLPDGPERLALIEQSKKILVAYMPYKVHVHRIFTDLAHPWVKGYHRNVFVRDFWKYVDVDPAPRTHASP
jgi:ABC-type transport system substrate-binding protein